MWCGLPSSRTSTQLSQETHWKIMDWAMLEVSGGAVVSGTRKENGCRSRGHPVRMKFTRSGFDVPKRGLRRCRVGSEISVRMRTVSADDRALVAGPVSRFFTKGLIEVVAPRKIGRCRPSRVTASETNS